jgi:hypothetical protein
MSKLVRDFLEIQDHQTLDALIARLIEVRDSLPDAGQTEVRMRGDDIFGRHLSIGYFREQTAEEAACDARYAEAYRQSRERELNRLQDELGFCPVPQQGSRRLRIVA